MVLSPHVEFYGSQAPSKTARPKGISQLVEEAAPFEAWFPCQAQNVGAIPSQGRMTAILLALAGFMQLRVGIQRRSGRSA